jgi:hypothetical protein
MRRLTAAIVAGLLAGCGSDKDEQTASEATAVTAERATASAEESSEAKSDCELLTDAEVSQAIGATVASHEESGLSGCTWTAEGLQLMLNVYAGPSMSAATCGAQKSLGTGKEESISGLGDSALWKSGRSLVVCSSRAVIRFNLDNSKQTLPQDKEGLIALARSVIDRV